MNEQRSYPLFSACGLNCGLCPRFHTQGASRCPGCAGEGFSAVHPSCGVLTCSRKKGVEYCFQCVEYPCKKYDHAEDYDSFITHRHMTKDFEKARERGVDAYRRELDEKVGILEILLSDYNDGRKKNLYCIAVNLLELEDVRAVMEQLKEQGVALTGKERAALAARLFQEAADRQGIILKLNQKKSAK
ncbi:MAG: DUF3795 domain-containing protein [Oscillospiraceae bacterium]